MWRRSWWCSLNWQTSHGREVTLWHLKLLREGWQRQQCYYWKGERERWLESHNTGYHCIKIIKSTALRLSTNLLPHCEIMKHTMGREKVTKQLKHSVILLTNTFLPTHGVFQDLMTGKKIVWGYECGGLYYFEANIGSLVIVICLSFSVASSSWSSSLQNLKMVSSCHKVTSPPCKVCEFSKHKRVSFSPCV